MSAFPDRHTVEVDNLAALSDRKKYAFDPSLLAFETAGPFWEILEAERMSLAVSREYEHFVVVLGATNGVPRQSVLPLPHPSGIAFDQTRCELILSSTRTPNLIFWLRPVTAEDFRREIVPEKLQPPEGVLFLPYRSVMLPGTLNIHEIALVGEELVATVTGHNFLARISQRGAWQRTWWPLCLDAVGRDGFRENHLQLNGIAAGATIDDSHFTAFSDSVDGPKPWKQGYGPRGKGVVFSGHSREVACRGLTCPHSIRPHDGALWLCNSGYGELALIPKAAPGASIEVVCRLPGFTRGLAFSSTYAFVGLSRVIESYEPYAPGVPPEASRCGVAVIDLKRGDVAASMYWTKGYQVFDVQALAGLPSVQLPFDPAAAGAVNGYLRYLG